MIGGPLENCHEKNNNVALWLSRHPNVPWVKCSTMGSILTSMKLLFVHCCITLFYYMSYTYYSFYVHIFDRSLVPDDFASRLWWVQEVPFTDRCVRVHLKNKTKRLFKVGPKNSFWMCLMFQVRRSMQSESKLRLQSKLVHLPGKHWENHCC